MADPVNTGASATNVQPTQATTADKTATQTTEQVTPEPKPWETVKHKIKYNDAEQELDYSELVARAQKGMGADSKYQEAAQLRKQAEAALKLFKTDPTQAFKMLNVDPKSWAAKYLEEAAYEAMLSPQEKEARDEKNKLLSQVQELEAMKREKAEAENNARMQQVSADLQAKFIAAIDPSGLPRTPEVVKRLAQKMMIYREAGYKDVQPADIISEVKKEYQEDLRAMLGGTADDQLESFLGEDTVKKLISSRNKKIQEEQSPFSPKKPKNNSAPKKQAKEPTKMTTEEWRRNLLKQFK